MELYLVYINGIGTNFRGYHLYEFLFAETVEGVDSDNWDAVPASGQPFPPLESCISRVGVLTSEITLHLAQQSDSFAMWDAVDGVIPLAWENFEEYDIYPENRVFFRFGETIKIVEDRLYEKDLSLDYSNLKKVRHED